MEELSLSPFDYRILLQERPALPQKRESLATLRKVDTSSMLLYKLLYFICLDVNHKTQRKAR